MLHSFSITSTSGQLKTKAALDYETKSSYAVTVSVSDGDGDDSLSDSIDVTINVTDANDAPVFNEGDSATRSIAENTATGQNIGDPIAATDADQQVDPNDPSQLIAKDTLTYTLGGTDAASFSIDSTSGQLQTNVALDYETTSSYSVTVEVSDGNGGSDSIAVTINVNDVNEAPTFASGTTISNISATAGTAIQSVTLPEATDPDAGDLITYTVTPTLPAGLTFTASERELDGTPTAVSAEADYTYTASDGEFSDTLMFTIQVSAPSNSAPAFNDDNNSTTRTIAENTAAGTNIGDAVAATDANTGDTLTYTLSGTDAASFSIVSTSGQLQTSAALDYETKASYSVTVGVSDGNGGTGSIAVTINVTDANDAPVFSEDSTTRRVTENMPVGQKVGAPVTATDQDQQADPNDPSQLIAKDTLTYSLSGTDAASFSIVSTSGQLKTKTVLDHEEKASYSVTVSAADGNGGTGSIAVTITVTDVNDAPVFTDGDSTTRSIAENTAADTDIGTPIAATDQDKQPDPNDPSQLIAKDTLTYTLGGTDEDKFSIVSTSGQLKTKADLNYETKSSYAVTVSVSDGTDTDSLSDSIAVTITVNDVNEAPVFSEDSPTRPIAENTAADTDIGAAVTATDPDTGDTLTYSLAGTDAAFVQYHQHLRATENKSSPRL